MGTIPTDVLRYAVEVADALAAVKQPENVWADDVPIKWHDEVIGFVVASEFGDGYDYAPVGGAE